MHRVLSHDGLVDRMIDGQQWGRLSRELHHQIARKSDFDLGTTIALSCDVSRLAPLTVAGRTILGCRASLVNGQVQLVWSMDKFTLIAIQSSKLMQVPIMILKVKAILYTPIIPWIFQVSTSTFRNS